MIGAGMGASWVRILGLGGLCLAVGAAVAGCSRIQEPWVSAPKELQQERQRTPEMAKTLRERARRVQAER